MYRKDCNRCNSICSRSFKIKDDRKVKVRHGMLDESSCKSYSPPQDTWMMAEILLAHPNSLNEALSALPFNVNLNFYLRG